RAAIFDGPMRNGPSLGVEDARPRDEVVLVHVLAVDQLAADVLGKVLLQERAHFIAEGQFLSGVSKVHYPDLPTKPPPSGLPAISPLEGGDQLCLRRFQSPPLRGRWLAGQRGV